MRIRHLSIRDMWSFGADGGELKDLGQTVVVIGKNNSGKSNILRGIHWFKQQSGWLPASSQQYKVPENDRHDYGEGGLAQQPALELTIDLSESELDVACTEAGLEEAGGNQLEVVRSAIADGIVLRFHERWSQEELKQQGICFVNKPTIKVPDRSLQDLGDDDGDLPQKELEVDIRNYNKLPPYVWKLVTSQIWKLTGWRRLDENTAHGSSYVKQLRDWERPATNPKEGKRNYNRVLQRFRELTGLRDARLEPLPTSDFLRVSWRNRDLDITAFGDGIRHLLMLGLEFALREGWVFLIEEPETHLHPELQRRLLEMMKADPQNQYIITTHSPILLDAGAAEVVYRVEYDGDRSTVERCETTKDLYRVLDQLDVRASDLLQANCVIWVEGPTDRMFLNKCLELRVAGFVQGIDYQFAYYAGRLRSHVSFDEDSELVNLLRLSRHAVMVCDSDRSAETNDIDKTKTRLEQECSENGVLYWITAGREIENYLPDHVLSAAYAELLQQTDVKIELGQYDKLSERLCQQFPNPERGDGWKVDYEHYKVRIMPEILKHLTLDDLGQSALSGQLDKLIDYIKNANTPAGGPAGSTD